MRFHGGGDDRQTDRERESRGQSKPKVRWKRNQKELQSDNREKGTGRIVSELINE